MKDALYNIRIIHGLSVSAAFAATPRRSVCGPAASAARSRCDRPDGRTQRSTRLSYTPIRADYAPVFYKLQQFLFLKSTCIYRPGTIFYL